MKKAHLPMDLHICPVSDVPIFRQLEQQILRAVAVGQLLVGDRLPAVRGLAKTLVICPNTVARAYQELIRDGVVESRSGRGVFVAVRRQIYSDAEHERKLRKTVEQLCRDAMIYGAGLGKTRTILETTWKTLESETRENAESGRNRK